MLLSSFRFLNTWPIRLDVARPTQTAHLVHHRSISRTAICQQHLMNRPRNSQPRPPRRNQHPSRSSQPRATPQQAAGTVPTPQQVIPGANVFIVLKQDQPTGKETFGAVAELLTRGAHPRGIKVRLQSGLVGRVQRMADAAPRFTHRYTDVRRDEELSEPPARSLADFMPASPEPVASANCPVCENFEGDETAVTRHIEKEHLE